MTYLQRSGQSDRSDPVQSDAGRTTALAAIRRAAEDPGLDRGLEVSCVVDRHFGEQAVFGARRGLNKRVRNARIEEEFG